jgi:tetratricopeptide (TPR) repeat protein
MSGAEVLRAALEQAQAGDAAGAFSRFTQVGAALGTDRELALGFAELLSRHPEQLESLAPAERIVAGFETVPEVIIPLTAALLRVAERRPPDEPPFEQGPAHLAAGVAQRCFESLPAEARRDPEIGGYLQINMADGLRMMGPDYDAEALSAYKLALAIDDSRGFWWFQLGLLHKWRGRFREALAANQAALKRLGPLKPVLWNLALCATALGEGKLALEAWEQVGIRGELSAAGMPFVPGMPPLQVRVATLGEETGQNDPLPQKAVSFELVWVSPLSPCHGVVESPTVRRASIDYGDVILWDGAPVRVKQVEGQPVPVFPLLWILRAGDERRLRFVGMEKARGMADELGQALGEKVSLFIYDRRGPSAEGSTLFYGKLIVPAEEDLGGVRSRLEAAIRARPGLTLAVPQLYELLSDTPAAGKSHQAWGGIERAAQRQGLLRRE